MKLLDIQAAIGTAILLLSSPCVAKHDHHLQHLDVLGKRHGHSHQKLHASPRVEHIEDGLKKRGQCTFPTNAGLVAVTPNSQNAGWAMSPDQPCTPGNWCPYACPPGQVMLQWNPSVTSYVYPGSMQGGLYCDSNGQISKPFPDKDYCGPGTGAMGAQNNCGGGVSFCQTVLPGNEAMLIPTHVTGWSELAVPGPSYWAGTASHFYINAPGVGPDDACVWGDQSKPIGNWAPYVAGGNTVADGSSFLKIGWNPEYTGCDWKNTVPSFGIEIVCTGGGCNGLPCKIDPSKDGVGGVESADQASGAGGASFCVVTVPSGVTANVVVFEAGSSGGSSGSSSHSSSSAASSTPSPTPTQTPTPTPTPSSSSKPSTSSTTSSSTSSSSSSSSSSISSSSSSSSSTTSLSSTSSINTTLPYPTASNSPHILFQNGTNATATGSSGGTVATGTGKATSLNPTATSPITSATPKTKNAANGIYVSSSFFSFSIALIAAGLML